MTEKYIRAIRSLRLRGKNYSHLLRFVKERGIEFIELNHKEAHHDIIKELKRLGKRWSSYPDY